MRHVPATLLISAMLNTNDPDLAARVGVKPEHFGEFRDAYEWVNGHYRQYGTVPTPGQVQSKFTKFPQVDTSITDPRQPASDLVREYAKNRLSRTAREVAELLNNDEIEEAYSRVSGINYETFTPQPENLLASESFLQNYGAVEDTIRFPWPTLQKHTGGFAKEQLMYFAARPSQGKSFFLVNIAAQAAFEGRRVMFYSLEMSKRELQVRSHAILAHKVGWVAANNRVNAFDMLHGRYDRGDYSLLLQQIDEQTSGTLHIHDMSQGRVTPSVIAARASEYDLTVIDYVGLMSSDKGQRSVEDWRVAAEISNELKSIARSKQIRILAAAQVNRAGDSGGKPIPPRAVDLGGTDAYVQDADSIVTMTRIRGGHAAALSIEKNRSGGDSQRFYTKFLANTGDFQEVSKEQAEDLCDRLDD